MDKVELLELIKLDRPTQNILEILDFRPSKSGIDGVIYDVDVKMWHEFTYESSYTQTHYDIPYPLKPFKDDHDRKIQKMLKDSEPVFKQIHEFIKNNHK